MSAGAEGRRHGPWRLGLGAALLALAVVAFLARPRPGDEPAAEIAAPIDSVPSHEGEYLGDPATMPAVVGDERPDPRPRLDPTTRAVLASQIAARTELVRDRSATLDSRIHAVRWLSALGTEQALRVVLEVLESEAPPALARAAAASLAESPHPDAARIVARLAARGSGWVALGALEGMAARGEENGERLLDMVLDEELEPGLRAAAVTAFSRLEAREATPILQAAFQRPASRPLRGAILTQLLVGADPAGRAFVRAALQDGALPLEERRARIEGLSGTSDEARDLLLELAAVADQPEIRVAALAALPGEEEDAAALVPLLGSETSPQVRAELYHSLSFHPQEAPRGAAARALAGQIDAETNLEARLHGYRLLGGMLGARLDPELAARFDAAAVPWLERQAQSGDSRYVTVAATESLGSAATLESRRALERLARSPHPQVREAAEGSLRRLVFRP